MSGRRSASENGARVLGPTVPIPQPRETGTGRHAAAQPPVARAVDPGPDPVSAATLLIVGVNYAPEEIGIAPLTTTMARDLAVVAGRVTVFTGLPQQPAGLLPMVYRRQRRTYGQDDGVQVVRHRHHLPAAPAGGLVAVGAAGRFRYEASFLRAVLRTPVQHVPDLVIGVTPSVGGVLAAARLARRFGVPLLVVVHGVGSEVNGGPAGRALALGRTSVLRRAARVVIPREELRAGVLASRVGGDRIVVVRPGPGALIEPVRSVLRPLG